MPQLRAVPFTSGAFVALVALLSAPVVARTAASPDRRQAGSRNGADLVAVDVRVSDKDGNPVPGLTAGDFAVSLDGQSRGVKAVDYQAFGKGAPAGAATPGRVLLLVVDDLSAESQQLKGLTTAAESMLAMLDDRDLVGVATTSGLGPSVAPTRDRAAVTAALAGKDLMGRMSARPAKPFVGINEAFDMVRTGGNKDTGVKVIERECAAGSGDGGGGRSPRGGSGGGTGGARPDDVCTAGVVAGARAIAAAAEQQTARQISAYARLMDSLAAVPGSRTMVVLSGGIALPLGASDALEIVGRHASESGVAVYGLVSIDESDLVTEASAARSKARREENTYLTTGLSSVALAGGGDASRMAGPADHAFDRIVGDTASVYRLGVDAPTGGAPKRFVSVKVSAKREGLTLRTSAEATRPSIPEATALAADALKQRVEQGGTGFAVPIALTTSIRRDSTPTKVQFIASVDVPASAPGPVTAMFAFIDSTGKVVQGGKKEMSAVPGDDYRLALPLPVDAGDYRLRVAVADAKGHVGSLDDVVSAKLPKVGSMLRSDLVTTSASGAGAPHLLAFETLPAHAQTLYVSLELYPDTAADTSGIKVQLSVGLASGGAPLVSAELPAVAREGRLVASATLPATAMKPDRYVITATVVDGGKPIGSAVAYVTKIN